MKYPKKKAKHRKKQKPWGSKTFSSFNGDFRTNCGNIGVFKEKFIKQHKKLIKIREQITKKG